MLAEQLTIETLPINTPIRQFYKTLFPGMSEYPKRRHVAKGLGYDKQRQYIYIGSKYKMVAVSTLSTLFKYVEDPMYKDQYYTNNGYYRNDQRLTEHLRWLNSYVIDFDQVGYSQDEILQRINDVGLPTPTALISTPSGGWHITYIFKNPIRATFKTIKLYNVIHFHMIQDLGADSAAIGANRIYRIPNSESLKYFDSQNIYDFEVFKSWREINNPREDQANKRVYLVSSIDNELMNHTALQKLLNQPASIGTRDATMFTLLLSMKASNWSLERARAAIHTWFIQCCQKGGSSTNRITKHMIDYKIKYVYRSEKLQLPSARVIRELTGESFNFNHIKVFEKAKKREERERSHLHEWIADLFKILQKNRSIKGTQKEIAARINCPIASFKAILRMIRTDSRFFVETTLGRNGITTISLATQEDINENKESHEGGKDTEAIISVSGNVILIFEKDTESKRYRNLRLNRRCEKPPD